MTCPPRATLLTAWLLVVGCASSTLTGSARPRPRGTPPSTAEPTSIPELERRPDCRWVSIPLAAFFDCLSTEPNPSPTERADPIEELAQHIESRADVEGVRISGHRSRSPPERDRRELSEARARAVAAALIERLGASHVPVLVEDFGMLGSTLHPETCDVPSLHGRRVTFDLLVCDGHEPPPRAHPRVTWAVTESRAPTRGGLDSRVANRPKDREGIAP